MTAKTIIAKRRPKGPGRRPAEDPKVRVMFYIESSHVKRNGGMEESREACIAYMKVRAQFPKKGIKPNK